MPTFALRPQTTFSHLIFSSSFSAQLSKALSMQCTHPLSLSLIMCPGARILKIVWLLLTLQGFCCRWKWARRPFSVSGLGFSWTRTRLDWTGLTLVHLVACGCLWLPLVDFGVDSRWLTLAELIFKLFEHHSIKCIHTLWVNCCNLRQLCIQVKSSRVKMSLHRWMERLLPWYRVFKHIVLLSSLLFTLEK